MILLEAGPSLSGMGLLDRIRYVRAELAGVVVISAVIAMVITETWRYVMITTQWLENLIERNKAAYDQKIRNKALDEFLSHLDEDTRREVERKLRRNGNDSGGRE